MNERTREVFSLRSLARLDQQLKTAAGLDRLVIFAKKAGYLAKIASISEARELIAQLRGRNSNYDPQLSAWIMFAEGLVFHFETLDTKKSKDKFQRAFLVSQMAKDQELAASSAAWLSLCELTAGQISDALAHLKTAFEWAEDDNDDALGRAAMVLADALNWSGLSDEAKVWYRKAREHAVRDGDIAMQNVMLYNSAAFAVSHLTLADCIGEQSSIDQQRTKMEVASARNLNHALGIEHLTSLTPTMEAELSVVRRDWLEAREKLDRYSVSLSADGQRRLLAKIIAQRAWCNVNLGDFDRARHDVVAAKGLADDCADLDDLAILHFRLSSTLGLLGDSVAAEIHRKQAVAAIELFRTQQLELQKSLREVIELASQKERDPALAGSQNALGN